MYAASPMPPSVFLSWINFSLTSAPYVLFPVHSTKNQENQQNLTVDVTASYRQDTYKPFGYPTAVTKS